MRRHHQLICCFRFLLPALHIKIVLEMPTIFERRKALDMLPSDLYDSFRGIINRIRRRPTKLGIRVLTWLHFTHRPLKLTELQHALAVEKDHQELETGNIPSRKVLLKCCLGLVLVDEETSTVRFTHFTVEEYFRKNAGTEFPDGCSSIAETCLTYLNFRGLRQHCMALDSLVEKSTTYAFLNYAACFWGTYVKQRQGSDSLTELARKILEHESERPPCAIQALYLQFWSQSLAKKISGIHVAAYFGLSDNMVKFSEVDRKDEYGRTPLSLAAEHGHEAVVRLLIEKDCVDINTKDHNDWTPLAFAVHSGHEAIVRLLIERDGIDINAKDSFHWTPLTWAAWSGNEAVVRLLIERDSVDIDAKGNNRKTPLMRAARCGREAVVRLLIEKDNFDINAKDSKERTALLRAVEYRHEAVVRLLVERDGVDIDTKDDKGKTVLMYAAEDGNEAIVQLLIERGGDINAKDDCKGWTPLMWAAYGGNEAVVRLLVERGGIDINAQDDRGWTPLIWAACSGNEAVVRLLVERDGIDINAKHSDGQTALSVAVAKMEAAGQQDIERRRAVLQLLDNRCDTQAEGSDTTPADSLP